MLCKEIIAVCSEIRTKHINTLCVCVCVCACRTHNVCMLNLLVYEVTIGPERILLFYILTIPNYSQQDAAFLEFISTDALHVSGGSSAHHQEHITVHTASGNVNQYCC